MWASTECQRFSPWDLGKSERLHTGINSYLNCRLPFYTTMADITILLCPNNECRWSVNGVSMIFDLASWILYGQGNAANPQSTYWQAESSTRLLTILHRPSTIQCLRSINDFGQCSASYTAMKFIMLFLNGNLRSQSSKSVLVYNFTNMYAMSHRSDFFACSARINILDPAFCLTLMLHSAVPWIWLPSLLIPTAVSASISFITLLLEVMISFKNERVFIHDWSDFTR